MSVLGIFDIGRTALATTRKALDATAHNVANAGTPGYTRQDVILESVAGGTVTGVGTSGRGVNVKEATRLYDSFLNLQMRTEKSNLSYWEAYQQGILKIENVFNEASDTGISPAISDFFNAWQDVAQNPEGSPQRTLLIKKAEYLSGRISSAYKTLEDVQSEIFSSSRSLVGEVNSIAAQITDLNDKISASRGALDLKDQRDSLIERLNQILKVSTFEDNSGRYSVLVNGVPIVDGGRAYKMTVATDSSNTMNFYMEITDIRGNIVDNKDITGFITGGELKANLDLRDTDVVGYMNKLNAFAHDITLTINEYHKSGYGLDGSTGNDFFKEISPVFVSEDSRPASGGSVSAIDITNLDRVNFEKRYRIDYAAAASSPGSDYVMEEAGATDIYWRVRESTDGVTWTVVDPDSVRLVPNTVASPDTRSLEFNGITITVSGDQADLVATASEEFNVEPNSNAAREMAVAITDTQKIAAASGDIDTQYTITLNQNDKIYITGTGSAGGAVAGTVTVAAGTYTRFGLATALQNAINNADLDLVGGPDFNVTVTFDAQTNKFKIVNNDSDIITLNWTNSGATLEDIFGFNADSIITQNGFDTSDLAVRAGTVSIEGSNNSVLFSEDGGATYLTATIPSGTYTRRELAWVLEQAFENAGALDYTVSYNTGTQQYTITNPAPTSVILDWTALSTTADGVFGFNSNTTGSPDTGDPVYPVLPGDNANARMIAKLATQAFMGGKTPPDYYRGIASDVGIRAQSAKTSLKFYHTVVDELERKRQEVSGVSLDEEAANLIKYQKSFEAAARMISVADELLETIIAMSR